MVAATAQGGDGRLYLLTEAHHIWVLAPDGTPLRTIEGWPTLSRKTASDSYGERSYNHELAIGPDGRLYIAQGTHVVTSERVVILQADGTLIEIWEGPVDSPFREISDIAVDAQGALWVNEATRERVVRRLADGHVESLSLPAHQILPQTDGSFIAVGHPDVQRYPSFSDAPPTLLGVGERGWDEVALAPNGSFFFYTRNRPTSDERGLIQRYDSRGGALEAGPAFADPHRRPRQFTTHVAFGVEPQGAVWLIEPEGWSYTGERWPARFLHLAADGSLLGAFPTVGGQPIACRRYTLAATAAHVAVGGDCTPRLRLLDHENRVVAEWEDGTEPFATFTDLAFAHDGQSLIVLDRSRHRLTRWALDGTLQHQWETDAMGIPYPRAFDIAADGTLFILDDFDNRVVALAADGSTRPIPLPDEIFSPQALAVAPDGSRLYIGGNNIEVAAVTMDGQLLGIRGSYTSALDLTVVRDGTLYSSTGGRHIYRLRLKDEATP